MNSVDIKLADSYIPIKEETIQELGNEFGESIFLIKTWHQYEKVLGYNKEEAKLDVSIENDYNIRTLTVVKAMNKWVATIDGHFAYNYREEIIRGICKLNII